MKNNKIVGYVFGLMMGVFFFIQILLVKEDLSSWDITLAAIEGVVIAIATGLLFNFFMRLFKSEN